MEDLDIKNYLEGKGYRLTDMGNGFWRTIAHYRGGTKETSLNISCDGKKWFDWVENIGGGIKDLIALIEGGEISDERLKRLIENVENAPSIEKIKVKKIYDPSILERMLPDYSYFLRRGISEKVQKLYKVGLVTSGKLRNRYTIPIFEYRTNHLIGFSGRYYKDKPAEGTPKWKHLGPKMDFLLVNISDNHIRNKSEVVLVESLGDCMALHELGVLNTICLFGTRASSKVINYIFGIEKLNKIWIALNNDIELNGGVGNEAAEKLKIKLAQFTNIEKISIKFPLLNCNDWNEYLIKKNKII